MGSWLYDGWEDVARTLLIGAMAYVTLVGFLRLSGKRTLAKLNAFDFVVTIALGSTLATILLNQDVSLAEGAAALGLLIGLQYVVTWSSVRIGWIRRAVTGEPRLLVAGGRILPEESRRARVTRDEIRSAVRAEGLEDVQHADAVILETDGSFSVIARTTNTAIDLTSREAPRERR